MRKSLLILFALGFLPALTLAGEQDLVRGQLVRITNTTGDPLTGRVVETTSDALVIELDHDGGLVSIQRENVASVETLRPRTRSQAAWSNAKWWALIGAASGLTLGFQHEQVGEDGATFAEAAALGAWSGGLFGGLIGAAVGALSPGDEWVKVSPRVQLGGRDPGFSLSVVIEF